MSVAQKEQTSQIVEKLLKIAQIVLKNNTEDPIRIPRRFPVAKILRRGRFAADISIDSTNPNADKIDSTNPKIVTVVKYGDFPANDEELENPNGRSALVALNQNNRIDYYTYTRQGDITEQFSGTIAQLSETQFAFVRALVSGALLALQTTSNPVKKKKSTSSFNKSNLPPRKE